MGISSKIEDELDRLCTKKKCEVCLVPFSDREASERHYSGKIHQKKVERWKEKFESSYQKKDSYEDEEREREDRRRRKLEDRDERGRDRQEKERDRDDRRKDRDDWGRDREERGRDRDERGRERDERGRDRDERGRDRDERGRDWDERGRDRDERGRDRDERGRDWDERGRDRDERGRDRDRDEGRREDKWEKDREREKRKEKEREERKRWEKEEETRKEEGKKKIERMKLKEEEEKEKLKAEAQAKLEEEAKAKAEAPVDENGVRIKTEAEAAMDIFVLAKKAREAIFLKKGEKEEKDEKEAASDRKSRDRDGKSHDRDGKSRDRDFSRQSQDRRSAVHRDDRHSRGRDDRRSRDRDQYRSRDSRDRDRGKDSKDKKALTKQEYMQQYQKELDKKLKKFDEKEEIIETWEERAKRKEKELKEAERKKKEEERERQKEEERKLREEEREEKERMMYDPDMTMDELEALKQHKGEREASDDSHGESSRSKKKKKKKDRNGSRSRSRSRDGERSKKKRKKDRQRSWSRNRETSQENYRKKSRRGSNDYKRSDSPSAVAAKAPNRSQDSDSAFADLYADEAVTEQPLKKGVIEEEKDESEKIEIQTEDGAEADSMDKKNSEQVPGVIDPRLLDSMDPDTMMRVLTGKSRFGDMEADTNENAKDAKEKVEEEEEEDDPDDMSIPINPDKLLRKCSNPVTGIGYCQICNKIFVSSKEATKHFKGDKHAQKVLIYSDMLLQEAAVRAGERERAPPPSQFYCELCESNCSSGKQMIQHLSGERHKKNVRDMEDALSGDPQLDNDLNPYFLPEQWLKERKHCNLCDVPIESIRMAKIHFSSRFHRESAGLNVLPSHKNTEYVSAGNIHCSICNFRTKTEQEMTLHKAGVRHMENERTKVAVEEKGSTWYPHTPTPPQPPKYSVVAESLPSDNWGGEEMGGGWGPGMMGGPPMWGGGPQIRGGYPAGPMVRGPFMQGGPPGMRMQAQGPGMGWSGMRMRGGPGVPPVMGGPQGMVGGPRGMMYPRGGMMGGPRGMMGGPPRMMGGPQGMMGGPQGMMGGPQGMMGGPQGMMGGPQGMMGGPQGMMGGPQGMMGGPQEMVGTGPGIESPAPPGESGSVEVPGPNALLGMSDDSDQRPPDDVTYQEFYCTVCKKQLENQIDLDNHNNTEEHAIAEANQEIYTCRLCKTNLTSTYDFNQHCETPKHLQNMAAKQERDHMRAMGQFVPDSDDDEEEEHQVVPQPVPEEGSAHRSRTHSWHCGLCNLWFPSITILKFYHSVTEAHLGAVKNCEAVGSPTCIICKASGDTGASMMLKCETRQKMKILGPNRQFSCDMCDVHLSEQEWLDNHTAGEKHRWVVDRVEKLLPVQFIPIDMVVVPKSSVNPFTGAPQFWEEFRCIVCKVGFSPIERYKKHVGSLFHLRRCAGEDVKWIDDLV